MPSPELLSRAENSCELCNSEQGLRAFEVSTDLGGEPANLVLCCETCAQQLGCEKPVDANHWRCLNQSMWSQEPAVQIAAWRMLTRLSSNEPWAADALNQLYLEPEILALAQKDIHEESDAPKLRHMDSNGNELASGDTVVLIKDLNVKGTSFTAKRGTSVRRISLDPDNAEHIEGRVNDQQIVILTKFVKKA